MAGITAWVVTMASCKVANGKVIGVEARDFPHNRGSLCLKGVVAYQQVDHPDRLRYPMIRRGGIVAVILLTMQAFVINRLARIPYPLWNPPSEPDDPSANKGKG